MAKNVTENASPRVSDIASRIHAACHALSDPANDMAEHQETIQALSAGMNATRLSVAAEVAAMSHDEEWTNAEIEAACKQAAKMGNADDRGAKTTGVFISEMTTFASPKVREHMPTILESCKAAWDEEQEYLASLEADERKGADTPVRKYKSRIYHLVIDIARQVKGSKLLVLDQADVVAWARAHDPDHDEDKVAKRLASIIRDIDGIHTDFGMEELKVAADYLRTVTAKELLAARQSLLDAAAPATGVATPAAAPRPSAPTPAAAPSTPAYRKPEQVESVMEGAVDVDAFFNDAGDATSQLAIAA